MKGYNTFIFNTKTVIEVMQYYFDNAFLKEKCKVIGFKKTATCGTEELFEIETRELLEDEYVQE